MSMSDFDRDREVFIGAWENDWYASSKLIFNECSEWVTHSVTTKRDYSNDYYFFECNDWNNWFPSEGSTQVFNNERCTFSLGRTQ